jgi:hypothetical protein
LLSLGLCARLPKFPLPPPLSRLQAVASASSPITLLFKVVTTYAQLDINVDKLSSEYGTTDALDGVDGPRSPASMCHNVVVGERHNGKKPSAMQAITIGPDLAKHWFQVRGVDAAGEIVVKRDLWNVGFARDLRREQSERLCFACHHPERDLPNQRNRLARAGLPHRNAVVTLELGDRLAL